MIKASLGPILRQQPTRGPASMYTIYRLKFGFNPTHDKSITKIPRETSTITGMVEDDDLPSEGGEFHMHHHRKNGLEHFGTISLEKCVNVVIDDEHYYFEDTQGIGKYLLEPCSLN